MKRFIHNLENWTDFHWDYKQVTLLLGEARNKQGKLLGRMESLGFDLQDEAFLKNLTLEVVKTSEIEGEILDVEQVRSSIARKLGIDTFGLRDSEQHIDGIVDMMLDATQKYYLPLTKARLFEWHSSLFPSEKSNPFRIKVGSWREDTTGPMQVVSGPMGKEKVHFQAPDSDLIENEMEKFLNWIEHEQSLDLVLKSAIAHFWFVTIHPFEDGNGRITRAITEMLLARSDKSARRFYSMSSQIRLERKTYYQKLEHAQSGSTDITNWIVWFLECFINTIATSENIIINTTRKAEFWHNHSKTILNERQIKIVNKLLDDFVGKLNTSKWAKINHCSQDTALRDIQDLINKGILQKEAGGGRNTHYELVTSDRR